MMMKYLRKRRVRSSNFFTGSNGLVNVYRLSCPLFITDDCLVKVIALRQITPVNDGGEMPGMFLFIHKSFDQGSLHVEKVDQNMSKVRDFIIYCG